MKAVILAGGEGTRLRPLTLTTPKPVVPVVDRPFLRHQLDLLATVGVTDVVFSVAYRPDRIEAVFGDGTALGRRIRYAVEETPLGTGGR
jgi:mannose-1-phosphate guanylyltransferase